MMHQCQYGVEMADPQGVVRPVRKATTWMTSMPAANVMLGKRCNVEHQHTVFEGSAPGGGRRTAMAQRYPDQLVDAICKAIVVQKGWGHKGLYLLGDVEAAKGSCDMKVPPEEESELSWDQAWDDLTGECLEVGAVRRARADEIQYYRE